MIDRVGAAHRRADCVLSYATAIVLTGLVVWTKFDPYTVNQQSEFWIPSEVAVTPAAAVFAPSYAYAEVDQSECLAEALYYEARGEGTEGEKAVAEVVLQRTRDANYPHTICGVVYEGVQPNRKDCQFSFACDGALRKPKERGTWQHVRLLADKIVSGAIKLAGETGHAIAYHSIDVDPAWADEMIETAQIGNHIFYRRDRNRIAVNAAAPDSEPDAEDVPQKIQDISEREADNTPAKIQDITDVSKEVHSEVQTSNAVGQGA
jgi:hypothetical protein